MKLLSIEDIRQADAYTIKHEPVKSIDLMERAAKACVKWMSDAPTLKDQKRQVSVFCGLGNNGGDGLAIARLLAQKKFKVDVFIIRYSDKCSDDFLANEKRLKPVRGAKVHNITSVAQLSNYQTIKLSTICIDAIFGSGLNKPVVGLAAEAIEFLNESGCPVISIDIPSGLFSDEQTPGERNAIVRANHTLTFQSPKLAYMFPESSCYVGDFSVLDIELDGSFIESIPVKHHFVTLQNARAILKPRSKFAHKGTCGHALIVSGSFGKMGACVLASKACLSAGAGLVTAHIPLCGYSIIQTSNPEVMAEADRGEQFITSTIDLEKYNAIGIGPGIGMHIETQKVLKNLIQNSALPLVLDADALNILSENKTWISFLQKNSILTPHPGEFIRLVGQAENDFDRFRLQKEFSIKQGVYLVLKGAHTCISCPDGEAYFNSTGNPGMATAGSGDVLTGIITGLLAQGYDSIKACVLGVYLHGLAGDIAAEHLSEESLMARNIIEFFGDAFKKVHS